jgi:hypothetical protein
MTSVKIKLSKHVELFGKRVAEIVIKEPTGGQYTKIGDPRTLVFSTTGSAYWVEDKTAIAAYYEALIEHEVGGEVLVTTLNLRDTMRLKEILFSFFSQASEPQTVEGKSTSSASAQT